MIKKKKRKIISCNSQKTTEINAFKEIKLVEKSVINLARWKEIMPLFSRCNMKIPPQNNFHLINNNNTVNKTVLYTNSINYTAVFLVHQNHGLV